MKCLKCGYESDEGCIGDKCKKDGCNGDMLPNDYVEWKHKRAEIENK